MATLNKKAIIKKVNGLPTKEQLLTSPQNIDTVPAVINNSDGSTAPAALTQGEFVFSLPAIIALGEGDYDAGLAMLEDMHTQLRTVGDQMLSEMNAGKGLSGVPPEMLE
jgi:hypothetical protein